MLDGEAAGRGDRRASWSTLADRGETAAEIAGARAGDARADDPDRRARRRDRRLRHRRRRAPHAQRLDRGGAGRRGRAACRSPSTATAPPRRKAGAADTLEALGLDLDRAAATAEASLADLGICFLFAQKHHPAMGRIMPIRRAIGRRTIFNLMGPLANPAGVTRQLIGIARPAYVPIYAEALARLGTERGDAGRRATRGSTSSRACRASNDRADVRRDADRARADRARRRRPAQRTRSRRSAAAIRRYNAAALRRCCRASRAPIATRCCSTPPPR